MKHIIWTLDWMGAGNDCASSASIKFRQADRIWLLKTHGIRYREGIDMILPSAAIRKDIGHRPMDFMNDNGPQIDKFWVRSSVERTSETLTFQQMKILETKRHRVSGKRYETLL
jgi:predicted HD phosphohydrolase